MELVGGCVVFKEMCVYVCVEGSISSTFANVSFSRRVGALN